MRQCAFMADSPMSTDFETWFADLTAQVTAERRALVRPWFASLHAQHGPVTSAGASIAWALALLDVAKLAMALTLADAQRTTGWQPQVELSTLDNAVGITVEGHTRVPATTADPWDQAMIVRDIAEIIQEDVSEWNSEGWPTCDLHGVGLHAEVQARRAVWWCRKGEHVVSEIGMLGA